MLSEAVCDGKGGAEVFLLGSKTSWGMKGNYEGESIYCVMWFSGRWWLARRAAHGRGAVGAGALSHGQSAGQLQLQLLEEGRPDDLGRLRTLTGAPRQHAVHHTQLNNTEKQDSDIFEESTMLQYPLVQLSHST